MRAARSASIRPNSPRNGWLPRLRRLPADPARLAGDGGRRQGGRLDRRRRPAGRPGAAGGGCDTAFAVILTATGSISDETAARNRPDPFRRHRRHRHERHRRGADQPRLHRAGLGRQRQRQRQAAARQGRQGLHRPQGREPRRRRGAGGVVGDQARQSGARRRARQAPAGGAPRRDAGRADAAEKLRRHRRHPRQDHDHLDGRGAARRRRTSIRP